MGGSIPLAVLVHKVTVEAFEGRSGTGPVYGSAVAHRCLIDDGQRLVRGPTGRERVAQVTLFLAPGTAAAVPLESRATVRGRVMTVVSVLDRDGGALPVPSHVEVMCE